MSVAILGVGTWLPERVRYNEEWPESFTARRVTVGDRTFNDIPPSDDPLAAAILERDLAAEARDPFLGATQRRVAEDSTSAVDAETEAARAALKDAGIDGSQVDLVLSYSVVPDRLLPATATAVAHRVGANRALALAIEGACATVVAQIEMAQAYVLSGLARVVLITQSHLLLRTFPLAHPACPGLGDAASAMVVAKGEGLRIVRTFGVSHGDYANAVTWVRGMDDENDQPWWKAGGDYRLGSRHPERAKFLMRETVTYGATAVREVASRENLDLERLSVLASVQPRGFIPGAIAERLGLPRERAVTTYDRIAHVGACGPVFNLMRARSEGRLPKGALAALYAQGAGFTRAAAIVEVTRE